MSDKELDSDLEQEETINLDTIELMKKNYSYPLPSDNNIQYKLYKKREYYGSKTSVRPKIDENTEYSVIKEYRDNTCGAAKFSLHPHQSTLSKYINPDTPYKGILVFHGLGSGKTCVGVAIVEKFRAQVEKYGTYIYILVPGPNIKESWLNQLVDCTGNKYIDKNDSNKRNAIQRSLQNIKMMSFRSFYKKVSGEKYVDRTIDKDNKMKKTYRKNAEGDFERDYSVDRIYNLDNTVLIIDEAHNLTGNTYGDAVKHIIKVSKNLKVVLMTATPMKNLGSDIVELINMIRPLGSPMELDKIFNSYRNHLMDFKKDGLEYFKNMINGYVSHMRGQDPLTFAKRVDMGEVPRGLMYTKVTRCYMLPFQREVYDVTIKEFDDALDRSSEAVANIVFPGLSKDRKTVVGYYSNDGINIVKEQLKSSYEDLNKLVNEKFFENKSTMDVIHMSKDNKTISGSFLKLKYLKYFAIKFYTCLKKINRLVAGKKGVKNAFIYSNLVKVGIDVFKEILLNNGYLEYQENINGYQLYNDTRCYYCGKTYKLHSKMSRQNNDNSDDESEDNSDDEIDNNSDKTVPLHKFYPATFVSITGSESAEVIDDATDDKKKIINNVFNKVDNKEGKYIKFILGSRVLNEGINMKNVGEVHILDVWHNFARVDQVVGRAIRWCSHYKIMGEDNVYPEVKVYKYVVALGPDGSVLSSEEEMYKKSELKYLLINKIERAMKERAIDCPLNQYGNMFNEEIVKYKDCDKHKTNECPAICNFTKCYYKCDDNKLNTEYYDPERKIYRLLKKEELDYSTFTKGNAETEIEHAKRQIINMYITNPVYTLRDIIETVKQSYDDEQRDMFDEFFVFKALDILLPVTENDFNNLKDIIVDKNNVEGYLIYRNKYYIFQPYDENEDIPLYYRSKSRYIKGNELSLYNYLSNSEKYNLMKKEKKENKKNKVVDVFDHDITQEYYDNREEYEVVGIIDKHYGQKKNIEDAQDVFKIRPKMPKIIDKKRGTGIPSIKGSVCDNSKTKEYLDKVAIKLGGKVDKDMTRKDVCSIIQEKLLYREKYATDKKGDKLTYIRIPSGHPIYPFPYNLEDRVRHIIKEIKDKIIKKIDIDVEHIKNTYIINIKNELLTKEHTDMLNKMGFKLDKNIWQLKID